MKLSVLLVLLLAFILPGLLAQPEEDVTEDTSVDSQPMDSLPPDSLDILEDSESDTENSEDPETDVSEDPDVDASEEPSEDVVLYEESIIPIEPNEVLEAFFQALRDGDSDAAGFLISEDGLESIDLILDILKENLDSDEETTMNRLSSAGYTASPDEIEDWDALEYFQATVVLPVMKSRYLIYDMQIGEFQQDDSEIVIPLVFTTSTGLELPFDAQLIREDDGFWKVSSFIGLNSFP